MLHHQSKVKKAVSKNLPSFVQESGPCVMNPTIQASFESIGRIGLLGPAKGLEQVQATLFIQ
jgi:hypothetical protein